MRRSAVPFATLLVSVVLLACGQGCGLASDVLIAKIIDEINKDDPSLITSAGRSLVAIDLSTGDRTVLSSDLVGSGAPFVDPRVAALDESRGEGLFWDEGRAAIVRVDLGDGDRFVLANATNGAGPILTSVRAMLVDAAGDRILLADVTPTGAAILSVDLATGDRTLVSDAVTGTGPALDAPTCMALHSAGNRVLVGDGGLSAVVSVNLGNGSRTTLSGTSNGAGPLFQSLDGLAMQGAQGPLLLLDAETEA
ncbi:MAG: YncE family protein, partial [Planctomycetota bacterium]